MDADALASAKGGSDGAASPFRVGPGDPGLFDISVIESGPGDRAHRHGVVVFGKSHPHHVVAGLVASNSADVVEQGLLVDRPHQGLVTAADGSQFAIQAPQRVLRAPLLGNAAANVKHTRELSIRIGCNGAANRQGRKGEPAHRGAVDRKGNSGLKPG
ncbi:MAG: hypothetical protein ABSA66_17585 [Roseiarcus sp.]